MRCPYTGFGCLLTACSAGTCDLDRRRAMAKQAPRPPTKKKELVAYLKSFGVHANSNGPVEKEPKAVLSGMAHRQWERECARLSGSPACPKHPLEYVGVCPRCSGIWPES